MALLFMPDLTVHEVHPRDLKGFTRREVKELIGGIPLREHGERIMPCVAIYDEHCLMKQLEKNRVATLILGHAVHGPVLLVLPGDLARGDQGDHHWSDAAYANRPGG